MMRSIRLASLALVATLIAAPALADGRDRAPVPPPTPLQPHAQHLCETGQLAGGHCVQPVETRRIIRRQVTQPAVVHRTTAPRYDFSGFNGGVGANVATGGYHGGGGVVILTEGGARFSGVRHYSSPRYSFAGARFHHGGGSCGGC